MGQTDKDKPVKAVVQTGDREIVRKFRNAKELARWFDKLNAEAVEECKYKVRSLNW